jgi:hypothetical protein
MAKEFITTGISLSEYWDEEELRSLIEMVSHIEPTKGE